MTLTLELSAEEEARLLAQARRQGQNVEDWAHDLVRAGLLTELPTRPGQTTPFQPITVLGPPVSQTLVEDRE
jgi:hypothetical protein